MDCVGLIQMTSGPVPEQNLDYLEHEVAKCKTLGAKWVVCPENALVFGNKADYHQYAEPLNNGPLQQKLSELAKRHRVWIVVGSMPIQTAAGVTTSTLVIDDFGALVTHYDKLHMFDVDVADAHKCYRESDIFTSGDRVVTTETPFGRLGLSICYDVRFPHLYSELRKQGAQIIVVPAAFTAVTGQAHWEALLRCRAIETQSWIVAVGQGGKHPCQRETWGHSMVVDPWGRVVAQLDQDPKSMVVEIDTSSCESIRQNMPIAQHSRFTNQF
ncbi:carbon-nitrogen hydrolase family protein [Vibrio sp. nBUS_14]|uniref:carbon-nitrogen hydrolase family protein n=1 Tax=Vibrio sp. nBUS_14 TaxID=3395321 RepID=UPI003EB6EDBC